MSAPPPTPIEFDDDDDDGDDDIDDGEDAMGTRNASLPEISEPPF